MAKDIQKQARDRVNAFYQDLFYSDLTLNHSTMYECIPDVKATLVEKAKLARCMAVVAIDLEIAAYTTSLYGFIFRKRVQRLKQEKSIIKTKW